MTFLEKLKEDNPSMTKKQVKAFAINNMCPWECGYEETTKECDRDCEKCWNREMPSTEIKQKVANPPTQETLDFIHANIEKIQPHFENPVIEKAYHTGKLDGRNETWEFVRIIYDMKCDEIEKIFGVSGGFWEVIRDFTTQEALAKLKAYEDSKIEVGDVVKCKGVRYEYVVMATSEETFSNQPFLRCLEPPYQVSYGSDEELIKTGKHINIMEQILEQIGE